MAGEIVQVVADHGVTGLLLFLGVILTRSRPTRELGRCLSIEIRWRYLRAKGIPVAELRRLLLDDEAEPSGDPPTTPP